MLIIQGGLTQVIDRLHNVSEGEAVYCWSLSA